VNEIVLTLAPLQNRLAIPAMNALPGILIASLVTIVAMGLARMEEQILGYPLLEPLVLALVLGLAIRMIWQPGSRITPGIEISAKQLLEAAIVLLGASLDLHQLANAGVRIVLAVAICVPVTIISGLVIGKLAGMETRLAVLVAFGNAICGNSAIAAVAPAIRAKRQDVASAIALTAVFGVGAVLLLPLLIPVFDLSDTRYGVVAGLSVYAVPQVLAATFPVSAASGQIGSLVKLTRVLMLGPMVALFAWIYRDRSTDGAPGVRWQHFTKFLPWFVIGFIVLAGMRTSALIPQSTGNAMQDLSKILTAVAMTALGLSVDMRSVRKSGKQVGMVVVGLAILLVCTALIVVWALGIG
jgi:uncharacterized integral membrane protein (TIGR00698 family)